MNKPVTIGIDARMWGPKQTGIGRYISCLSREFFKLAPNVRFVLFMRDPSYLGEYYGFNNIKTFRVNERWYSFGEQTTLPLRFLNKGLDVLFVPHFNVPLLWRGKFVTTIHDVTPLFFPGHLQQKNLLRIGAFKKVFSSTLKRAEHIIAVSSYTKDQIVDNFNADKEKISVVYEGISEFSGTHVSDAALTEFRVRHGLNKPYIFFVGVWRPHKNIVGLLEAFAFLKKRLGSKYILVLGGEEDRRYPEIRIAWERLSLEGDIVRPGFIPDNELPLWYKASSVTVIPSFVEGFGLVGLEAIKYGSLIAASTGGATPEILKEAASYFDPKDSKNMSEVLLKVLEDDKEGERQRIAASGILSHYSWQQCAEQTLDILLRAAGKK